MNSRDTYRPRVGFWVVLILGVFAWAPAAYPGYWQGLEGFTPVFNALQPGTISTLAADADLWRGTGSAAYILAQPFLMLGLPATATIRFLFAFLLVIGGLSVYAWMAPRWGDRAAGLAGFLYMLLPPVLATVYVRGSLADAWILALLPLALAAIAYYGLTVSPAAAAALVVSILWMWRTQAGLALLATVLLFLYALLVERNRIAGLVVAVSGVAGFVSLIPLWSIQRPAPVDFFAHFVYAFQLGDNGWTVAPSIPGWQDEFPFQLGFAALALGVLALWLWLSRAENRSTTTYRAFLGFAAIGTITLVLLSLNPAGFFWRITGLHRMLTYPWQTLLLAMPLLAALAGSVTALLPQLSRVPYWPALVGLTLLASYPYLRTDFTQYAPPDRPYATLGGHNEIVLLEAFLEESTDPPGAQLDVVWQTRYPLATDYSIFFQAQVEDGDGYRSIAQLDMPPHGEALPPTSWRPGEILEYRYELDLAQAAAAGDLSGQELRYIFGYYDWRDGVRLPVDGGIDDKLIFYGR
jgi:hypothetical protein